MAATGLVLGTIKTALKLASKKTLADLTAKGFSDSILNTLTVFSKSSISDTTATILNRLKSYPTKELYNYASKEIGLPVDEIRTLIGKFNQTTNMKDISKGTNFKNLARSRLKETIGVNYNDSINDILNKVQSYATDLDFSDDQIYVNRGVHAALITLETELKDLIEGVTSTRKKIKFNYNIVKQFDTTINYIRAQEFAISSLVDEITISDERYEVGQHGEVDIIEGEIDYDVYSLEGVNKYKEFIEDEVRNILGIRYV